MSPSALYVKNRLKLMRALPEGLIVVSSSAPTQRNSDVDYVFRQNSDFLYLTGIAKPNYTVLLDPKTETTHLFIPDLDTHHRIWVGHQIDKREAKALFGADLVHYASSFGKVLKNLKRRYKILHAFDSTLPLVKPHALGLSRKTKPLRQALDENRVRKSAEEIALMREANFISKQGHLAAMRATRPGLHEYSVSAAMESVFRSAGAPHNAYPSIVAGGANAAVLHYHDNEALLCDGDLLLIDAAAECHGYAADVTRTFPVNGRFTEKQKNIYTLVLSVQEACIQNVRPGVSMLEIQHQSQILLAQGLIDLGIFRGLTADEAVRKELIRLFYPHGIGHLLGLDVHDVGGRAPDQKPKAEKQKVRTTRKLEANFVVTIEPGLYFIKAYFDDLRLRKRTEKHIDWKLADTYRSVGGIRIEDDILVTPNGPDNLTDVPKSIEAIEALVGRS